MLSLTTLLLQGTVLSDADFDTLALIAQQKIENKREWVLLKGSDSSLTFGPADYNNGALTAKALPAAVIASLEFLAERPVILIDSAGNELELKQIPLEARQAYYNIFGKYIIDYFNNTIIFTGVAPQNYTVRLSFKQVGPAITSGASWIFPSRFHAMIPFGVASMYKKGIDYDFVNALQAANGQDAEYADMWQDMLYWDAKMQADSVSGLDRYVNNSGEQPFVGGQLNNTN